MRRMTIYSALVALTVVFTGCSQESQRETNEALDEAGQAVESAAEDAANVAEGAVEGASQAIEENQAQPDTEAP